MGDRSKGLSIIAKDLKVEGTVRAKGKLIIAGELEGTLIGDEVVTVEGSRVRARAKVQQIVIAGEFEGNITAYESLRILPTGDVCGNIVYKNLTLEAGGILNGHARPLASKDEALATDTESVIANVRPSSRTITSPDHKRKN